MWLIVRHPVNCNSEVIVSVTLCNWEVWWDFSFIFLVVSHQLDADKVKFSGCGNQSCSLKPAHVRAAVNAAVLPALSKHFPVVEEMACEERSLCLCSMFTSPLPCVCMCVCLPRTWAITAHTAETIISAITYLISYEKHPHCRVRIMEPLERGNTQC